MTESSEMQTFVIATARLKVKELTPEEKKHITEINVFSLSRNIVGVIIYPELTNRTPLFEMAHS
jgi:hypothetical protein